MGTASVTSIEWTDATWNPVTGCTKVSAGCKNCYAETIANRRLPHGGFTDREFTEVRCHPERLAIPLHWRKPRRVFVNSMSDLFHETVSDEFIDQVFAVMALCPQHTFQVLTKRPERMLAYCNTANISVFGALGQAITERASTLRQEFRAYSWPLPNVWLGVSVEDQATADERIPLLLETTAAVRFVSAEPLLGPIDLSAYMRTPLISWAICGGESGHGARPCNVAWIRSIVEQCKAAEVAVFVKQIGARAREDGCKDGHVWVGKNPSSLHRLLHRKGGDPSEWPEDLRVRAFP
jgi:protein gp37